MSNAPIIFNKGVIIIALSQQRPGEELKRKLGQFNNFINFNTKNPNANEDVDKIRNTAYGHVKELVRLSEFALITCGSGTYRRDRIRLINERAKTLKARLLNVETIQEIKDATVDLLENVDSDLSELSNLRGWMFSEAADKLKKGTDESKVYFLSDEALYTIANTIRTNNSKLTMFSPQCGDGTNEYELANLIEIKNRNTKVQVYGLEDEGNGATTAKTKLTRVIKGSLKGSTISNEAFDIVFVNPRISVETSAKEDGKLYDTNEDMLLKNTIRYLKDGGVFIYTIPYDAFTPSMKLYLSKWLKNYIILKQQQGRDEYRNAYNFITIIGTKEYNPSYSDSYMTMNFLEYGTLNEDTSLTYSINLPDVELKLFRGSILDDEEIDNIILNDGLYADFYADVQQMSSLADTRPLLPFNIGQIGLILSSGSLDGVVEEANGVRHVIKGMTVKESDTVTESSVDARGNAVIESTTTVRNKVQISAFGADGTFYNLA